jgi:uncharacterized protein (TIGR03435 family)
MKTVRAVVPVILWSAAAFAQASPPRLEFEVASIKPSAAPVAGQITAGVKVDGAQVHGSFLALKDYIRSAYKVKDTRSPAACWARSASEIDANPPWRHPREQVPEMLQSPPPSASR